MRILIAHNAVLNSAAPDEADVMVQVKAVYHFLVRQGHDVLILPCDLDLNGVKRRLAEFLPDVVFNLVESLDGQGNLIAVLPFLLSAVTVPHTGASAESLFVTSHKIMAKKEMVQKGLPTPDWFGPWPEEVLSERGRVPIRVWEEDIWIIKSVWEHASLGIDGNGLVKAESVDILLSHLKTRASQMGGECFAEKYVDGREFNLSLLAGDDGPIVLAPAEIQFQGYDDSKKTRIVCYDAKWNEASYAYHHTPRCFDFPPEDHDLLERLKVYAIRCWHLFHLRGYARVDFRVDKNGCPWILEVNANPCLSPDAGFAAALNRSGISFDTALSRIIDDSFRDLRPVQPDFPCIPPIATVARTLPPGCCFRYDPVASDAGVVRALVARTGFFHDYEVNVAVELVEERLHKGMEESGYAFVFLEEEGRVTGYACYGPIPCTRDSYDIYWIAVMPEHQKKGLGTHILREAERLIQRQGGKRVYIDTSDSDKYRKTFAFYNRCGYRLVSLLEDFYAEGDGKAILLKTIP